MTANEQAARDYLAAYIRDARARSVRAGTGTRLAPYWREDFKGKHADYIRGFVSMLEAEPLPVSTVGAWGDFHGDGWMAALDWSKAHALFSYRKLQKIYALGDLPLSRATGGPFYQGPSWWEWTGEVKTPERKKVWRGPSSIPTDPRDTGVLMAVTRLDGAVTRWNFRRRAGRTNPELLCDIVRELGSVSGDHIPHRDERASEDHPSPYLHYHSAGDIKDTHGHGPPVSVTVLTHWLSHSDKERHIAVLRRDALIGAVRRVFKIPANVDGKTYFESTGQAVMI